VEVAASEPYCRTRTPNRSTCMPHKLKIVRDLLDGARRHVRARWVKVGGAVGLFLLALQLFFEEQVVRSAGWVWLRLRELAHHEVGVTGLIALAIFVGVAVVVTGLAYIDSRPKPTKPASAPLTKEERDFIQLIRNAWNLRGEDATFALLSLLGNVIYPLKERHYWGVLLQRVLDEFDSGRNAMKAVVAPQSVAPLAEVCETFNHMYNSYAQAMLLLSQIAAAGDVNVDETPRYSDRLESWMDLHYAFVDELMRIDQVPELHRRLKLSTLRMQIMNQPLANLLREVHERHTRRIKHVYLPDGAEAPSS
jgi:hypothetical protein